MYISMCFATLSCLIDDCPRVPSWDLAVKLCRRLSPGARTQHQLGSYSSTLSPASSMMVI